MSFQSTAPQVIRIKRKREDAPLESLLLENDNDAPEGKRRNITNIDHAYIFRRVVKAETRSAPVTPQRTQQSQVAQNDGIPVVKATAPGEEKRDPFALRQNLPVKTTTPAQVPQHGNSTPRRFELTRPSAGLLLPGLAPGRKRKQEVATFVERKAKSRKSSPERQAGQINSEGRDVGLVDAPAPAPPLKPEKKLKRPNARARLNLRPTNGATNTPPSRPEDDKRSPETLSKMEAWAQETEQEEQLTRPSFAAAGAVPAPYGSNLPTAADEDTDMNDADDAADYVFDTYVRHYVSGGVNKLEGMSTGAFGTLVIGEEDQELWESYFDDEDEVREFESDGEDSNAEDYYGADYPEDEVDDEDEYDRGAYNFRHGASDDEEYGSSDEEFGPEDAAFSDHEGEKMDFTGGV